MKKIILILLITTSIVIAQEYKVVFNLTSGNENKVASNLIKNIHELKNHYQKNGDTLETAIVISGNAYKFFRKDVENKLDDEFLKLNNSGTEFKVCSVGLKKRGIHKDKIDDFVIPAFNRTSSLIKYQNNGYAYIEIK